MSPELRTVTADTARALVAPKPIIAFASWWAALAMGFALATAAREALGTVGSSTWQYATWSPAVLLFLIGLGLPTMLLPRYVVHGSTRRAFALGSALVTGSAAVAGGLLMAVGFAVESFVYEAQGWTQAIEGTRLFAGADQPGVIVAQYALVFAAWAITGWLAGTGYYRWGGWWGTLFLVPAALPLVLAEILVTAGSAATPWGSVPLPLSLVIVCLLVVVLAGAIACERIVRSMTVADVVRLPW